MTEIGLLGALGSTIGLLVFAFWQAKRAANMTDQCLSITRENGELKIQFEARGNAITDRDTAIRNLVAERKRLDEALQTVTDQRDKALVLSIKDPHAAVSAARDALAPKLPPVPSGGSVPPATTPGR
jgi:hypothetical protein